MKSYYVILILLTFFNCASAQTVDINKTQSPIKVGIAAILSGDLAVFGSGDVQAARSYLKHFSRHNIQLVVEDARLTSSEGLRAYQKLINIDKAHVIIAAGTSNGIMAAKGLVNSSQTVTLMASTGGYNIDRAGPWLFRVGNSDTLNGIQQAKHFLANGITRVALLTELTEYTTDISKAFQTTFVAGGGTLVYNDSFLPNTNDFRSQATVILRQKPQAIFMPTQTGTALGIFVKQLRAQEHANRIEVHTTMVAAPNPDAHAVAGRNILGVYYMDPDYDSDGIRFQQFMKIYRGEYSSEPAAPFHVAAVLESLELIQRFLDKYTHYNNDDFRRFLSEEIGETCGYVGCYRLDSHGNSDLGFHIAVIDKQLPTG